MKKITYVSTLDFTYTSHSGAHYLVNSEVYQNHGQVAESIVKQRLGLYTRSNPSTAYDEGSDIEEYRASVKSENATLVNKLRGSVNEQIKTYFKNVHSSVFVFVDFDDETAETTEYWMNKKEFGRFVSLFTHISNDSRNAEPRIRFNSASRKMISWLNAQC